MLKDPEVIELIRETNRILSRGMDLGIADNTPPKEMVDRLRKDVFVFSACKSHIELKELSGYLVDHAGRVTGWSDFRKSAKAVHHDYNETYLEAEYQFAHSSAQMAAKWADVAKDGDRYNLQYRTAKDNRVRESHRVLDGKTLPASDPFWDSYYPPNGWRCRCTVLQVLPGKYPLSDSAESIREADAATMELDSQGRDRNHMFRFNPGKQAVIFPPKHPYRKVQDGIKTIIDDLYSGKSDLLEARRAEYLKLKADPDYTDVAFREDNGGLKATHKGHQFQKATGNRERQSQQALFNKGHKVIFGDEKPSGIGIKIPDGTLDDRPFEIASIVGKGSNTVKRALNHCRQKNVRIAVIHFSKEDFSRQRFMKGLAMFNNQTSFRFDRIIYIDGDTCHYYK